MFRPMKIEVTVMAIEIKEFRGGVHIGTIRRDLQIIVINCPNNHPPVLSGPYYKEVCAGSTVTFSITGGGRSCRGRRSAASRSAARRDAFLALGLWLSFTTTIYTNAVSARCIKA